MASETRDFTLTMPPQDAYALIRRAGNQIPSFSLKAERADAYWMKFSRLLGWSNPMDVEVSIYGADAQSVRVQLKASLLALADPFGFMKGVLDMFQGHIQGCYQATIEGRAMPPPPSHDKRGLKITLIIFGVVFGILFLMVLFFVVLAVLG